MKNMKNNEEHGLKVKNTTYLTKKKIRRWTSDEPNWVPTGFVGFDDDEPQRTQMISRFVGVKRRRSALLRRRRRRFVSFKKLPRLGSEFPNPDAVVWVCYVWVSKPRQLRLGLGLETQMQSYGWKPKCSIWVPRRGIWCLGFQPRHRSEFQIHGRRWRLLAMDLKECEKEEEREEEKKWGRRREEKKMSHSSTTEEQAAEEEKKKRRSGR